MGLKLLWRNDCQDLKLARMWNVGKGLGIAEVSSLGTCVSGGSVN